MRFHWNQEAFPYDGVYHENRVSESVARVCCLMKYGFIALVVALLSVRPATAQEWLKLHPTGSLPQERVLSSAVYDPAGNHMILFGGFVGTSNCGTGCMFDDVWVLSNANGADAIAPFWTKLTPGGATSPARRYLHNAVYDEASNRMVVFGGSATVGFCPGTFNDVWVLKDANGVGSPEWIKLNPTGTLPAARRGSCAAYDPVSNRMIIYGGGKTNCGGNNLFDIWVLKNANGLDENGLEATPNWIKLSPTGGSPPTDGGSTCVYDQSSNRMMFWFHRSGSPVLLPELWALDNANGLDENGLLANPNWVKISYTGALPPINATTSVYDAATNEIVNFAGISGGTLLNDVFVLENANGLGDTPTWTQLAPVPDPDDGLPGARLAHVSVIDPNTGRMMIFGGRAATLLDFNDTWVLIPEPRTPEKQILAVSEDILSLVDPNPETELEEKLSDKLVDVIAKFMDVLDELAKDPPDNEAAVGNIEGAVGDLEAAVKDVLLDADLGNSLMDQLAGIARQMAVDAITTAVVLGGDPVESLMFLDDGDLEREAGAFKDAVAAYKDALAKAED